MNVTVAGEGAPPPPLATASVVSSPTLDEYATGQLTSLTLTSSEPGKILVEWIPASSPTGDRGRIPPDDYRVSWVKGDGTFPSDSDTAGNADVMGASYTLTGLENGQTYRVRVRANYPAGSLYLQPAWAGPWTEVQIVVASPDSDPRETPTTIVLVPAVIPEAVVTQTLEEYEQGQLATMTLESPEAGNIDVTWTAPSLPTDQTPSAYHVNWAKDQEPYPDSAASNGYVEVTGSPHTLTGLESGQTYRVRVRAHYPQGSNNAWNGPWTELEIVSATSEITGTVTNREARNDQEQLETATQNSVSMRALSAQAAAITHDSLDFATYITRVWVRSQHNLVELSWKRPTENVSYRIWRAPAGDAPYTVLAEGNDVTTIAQPAKSGSRFYYTDKTVTAATSYKYAIQVLDNLEYSEPYEALASTTEWIAPRTTTLSVAVPRNEHGDYLLGVGEKVRATVDTATASDNFILILRAGEAYRVELYAPFVNEDGHYRISLGSITQVANGQTMQYESNGYRPPTEDRQVFWDGNVLKSTSGEQLSYVFHAPAAGQYRIHVRTDYGPTQYEFKVSRIPDQPDIPSFRAPYALATNGGSSLGHHASVVGNIGIDDQDWFAVKLEGAKSYRISLAAGDLGWQGLSNPRFAAMAGPDGVQVQPGFSGGRVDRFMLNVPRDEGGYYHLGVSGASASDRGLYVFNIVEEDFPTNPDAPIVDVGQQIIGMLEAESDVDWVGANLQAGRTYRITVSGSSGDIGGRVFARSISLGSGVCNTNGQLITLSGTNAFSMETAANHGGNVHYITGKVTSAKWKVATNGLYFFEIKKGTGSGWIHGTYYFQITDITP